MATVLVGGGPRGGGGMEGTGMHCVSKEEREKPKKVRGSRNCVVTFRLEETTPRKSLAIFDPRIFGKNIYIYTLNPIHLGPLFIYLFFSTIFLTRSSDLVLFHPRRGR